MTKNKKSKPVQKNDTEQPGNYEKLAKGLRDAPPGKMYNGVVHLGLMMDASTRVARINRRTIETLQAKVDDLERRNQMLVDVRAEIDERCTKLMLERDAAEEKAVAGTLKHTDAFLEFKAEIASLEQSRKDLLVVVARMSEML